jgi:hypothetical protein
MVFGKDSLIGIAIKIAVLALVIDVVTQHTNTALL